MTIQVTHPAVQERISKWLGNLPPGWSGARLNQVAEAWTSNVDKHTVEGQPAVRLCNYTDVYKNDVISSDLDFMKASATPEQIVRFHIRHGDTIITKDSETADDIGIPAYVEYEADDLVCGYHLAIVRPDQRAVIPRFLHWVMASDAVLGQWRVLAAGVTRVGLRSADLTKVTIPLPPTDEQRAIVNFLDRETVQIDALISKQNVLIEMLRERRTAVVDRIVWSGVTSDIEQTTTGIETAPVAPRHWMRLRNKNVFVERSDISEAGDEELLTVSHITGVTPRSEKNVTMFEAESLEGYRIVRVGDLAINTMWAWMGALGVSTYDGIVSPAYGVYVPRPGISYVGRYFDYFYRSSPYVTEMARHSRGIRASRLRLYPEVFLRLPVVVPPLEEQKQIVTNLDEQTETIDALIAKAQQHIEFARERRAALITEAVTGRIDVTGRRES